MVNGRLLAKKIGTAEQIVEFPAAGRYDITAFDEHGRHDRISVSLQQSH